MPQSALTRGGNFPSCEHDKVVPAFESWQRPVQRSSAMPSSESDSDYDPENDLYAGMSSDSDSDVDSDDFDEIFGTLHEDEERWSDRYEFLQSKGYVLRTRLRPGWVPSWRASGSEPFGYEDAITSPSREHLIDARRVSDNSLVYIKRVKTGDLESSIATYLSSERLASDPRNHCVPILEMFEDPDDPAISYMVMPFLRPIDKPPCELVEEVVDFVTQILEGLVFLHELGVAHRDCAPKNLMMVADAMYPFGFHPILYRCLPDGKSTAPYLRRSDVGVRYYYIDFGISVRIPPEKHPKLVTGFLGRDREVPELSATVPYDPFKVDVFIIGNVLRRQFYDVFSNVDFLQPLIDHMTQADPANRPSAAEALNEWETIRSRLSLAQRRWRLKPREESRARSLVLDARYWFTFISYCSRCALDGIVYTQG
ncbi:hypothetical protein OBBRIDRAFT_754583 [Obba rivulosa]|uniref:Protein kinase domain-containing protein n=1 Tax=Obba rivulosa TaxID=1052685 RepID=A0A8E2DNN7_9APHY|nr:hypothetical protein OBBRIDRAFT_754583 [Obba rivulosa]